MESVKVNNKASKKVSGQISMISCILKDSLAFLETFQI